MKKIFSGNRNYHKNAIMNWRTSHSDHISNMRVVAEGFADSAIHLLNLTLEDNHDKKGDALIFPIFFNANHSIEVYLKAIAWSLNKLLESDKTFEGIHNLKKLTADVKELGNELEKSRNQEGKLIEPNSFDTLDTYLTELYEKIERLDKQKNGSERPFSDITFSRYPLGQNLAPQFYILSYENVTIDLENFLDVFTKIIEKLDEKLTHYEALLEMVYEVEQIEREIRLENEEYY